jgi:hypothetical protein
MSTARTLRTTVLPVLAAVAVTACFPARDAAHLPVRGTP